MFVLGEGDVGSSGKSYERAFFHALDLLGMPYERNANAGPGSGRLWDVTPKGKAWVKLIQGEPTNLKVAGTKWLFADRQLAGKMPWSPGEMPRDYDFGREASKVKRYLNSFGLEDTTFLYPRSDEVMDQLVQASQADDVSTLRKLLTRDNFLSFDLSGYQVALTPARDGTERLGSIALRKGGKVLVRSERPRPMGGTDMVAFRIEQKPDVSIHPLKKESKMKTANELIEAVMGGASPESLLREGGDDNWFLSMSSKQPREKSWYRIFYVTPQQAQTLIKELHLKKGRDAWGDGKWPQATIKVAPPELRAQTTWSVMVKKGTPAEELVKRIAQ